MKCNLFLLYMRDLVQWPLKLTEACRINDIEIANIKWPEVVVQKLKALWVHLMTFRYEDWDKSEYEF